MTLDIRLPFAIKLMGFFWEIVSQTELRFSVVCNKGQSKTEILKQPIDISEIPAACVASNDFLLLHLIAIKQLSNTVSESSIVKIPQYNANKCPRTLTKDISKLH